MEFFKLLNQISPPKTILIVLLSLVYGVASGLFPMTVLWAVEDILSGTRYESYAILLPLLVVVLVGAKRLAQQFTAYLAEAAVEDLTLRIADAVRQDELREFEQRDHTAIYLSIVDARIITKAITRSVEVLQQVITLLTCWLYIFSLSHSSGLILIGVYLFTLLLYEVFHTVARGQFQEIAHTEGEMFGLFRHLLNGFAALKIHHPKHADLYANYLAPCVRAIRRLRFRAVMWNQAFEHCITVLFFTFFAIEVFVLAAFSTPERILELLVVSLYLFKPMWIILFAIPLITKGDAALGRLHKLTGHSPKPSASEFMTEDMSPTIQPSFHELTLQDVTFTYHDRTTADGFAVGPVTLQIRRGELLFIAGGNGSGKTTLLKLLTGLYRPDRGGVTLDGMPVMEDERRDLFAAVLTDGYVFDRLYGINTVDEPLLERLLQQMELTDKTAYTQGRFQTLDLSHGQQKRLALMVALLEDKPICLFDEWAADQDSHFRHYFYNELLPQLHALGKTIIAVTHDDQFYHVADRVILMDEGRIARIWHPQTEPELPIGQVGAAHMSDHAPLDHVTARAPIAASQPTPATFDADRSAHEPILTWQHFKPQLIRLGGMALLAGIAEAIQIYLLLTAAGQPGGWADTRVFIGFVLVLTVYIISVRRFSAIVVELTEQFVTDLRFKILDTTRQTGLLIFEALGAERLYAALTTDMLSVSEVSRLLTNTLRLCVRFISQFAILAIIAPGVFLFEMALFGVVGVVYLYNQFHIKQAVDLAHDGETELFRRITDLLKGFPALRLNARKQADFFQQGLRPACARIKHLNLTTIRYLLVNYMLVYGVFMGSIALLPLLIPVVSHTSLWVIMVGIGMLMGIPINTLIEYVPQLLLTAFAIRRLVALERRLTDVAPEPDEAAANERVCAFESLRYQNLAFHYPTQDEYPFTVGPVNLDVQAGELLFLTGGNGSGKTTLLKLLSGLYAPDAGQVLLNGQPVDMRRHRYLFATIFSEAHLFDRLYGLPQVDARRVQSLLELMQLDQKVQYVDGRFTTLDLSTGQKKRLALICAILEDRPIYLFDEWAAGQDPSFRHYFYGSLLPQFKAQGKTVIAITHDDRYVHVADRVVKMEYGQLVTE